MSEFGEVRADFGGVVIVAEERLTDQFSQLIYSDIRLLLRLMSYSGQWAWDFFPRIRSPVEGVLG